MNKNKNRLLMLCFTKMLQQRLEKETDIDTVSLIFTSIFSKEELQDIIKWLYMEQVPEQFDLETMDKQELLEAIGNDFYIISYTAQRWKKELEEQVTPKKVYDVLCQLQLETHYLMTKMLEEWDEYDRSNFKALCQKAGTSEPLYAVFESSVKEEDKYITLPLSTYYQTQWEANAKLSLLIAEEQFLENELQILCL